MGYNEKTCQLHRKKGGGYALKGERILELAEMEEIVKYEDG